MPNEEVNSQQESGQQDIDPVSYNRQAEERAREAQINAGEQKLILGKFKTQEDLEGAYQNLEKEFHKYGKYKDLIGAPEEHYTLDALQEKKVPISNDDPVYNAMSEVLKNAGVSQKVHDTLVEAYYTSIANAQPKVDEELKKLGDNGQDMLSGINNWKDGSFSDGEKQLLDALVSSYGAPAIQLLGKIKGMTNQPSIPTSGSSPAPMVRSKEEIKKEITDNIVRYGKEPAYRKQLFNELDKACQREGR